MSRLLLAASLACPGCVAAGPYGYARSYTPLSEEDSAVVGAVDYDPVMVARKPRSWVGKKVSVFGSVTSLRLLPDGTTEALLAIRTLQPRNLCENDDQGSCRVTISEADFGTIHAKLHLRKEQQAGPDRITAGSLVRVVGTIDKQPHPETGNTVIDAQYYRHWPALTFVTTAARSYMLR